MQCLPLHAPGGSAAIHGIGQQRMPQVLHVHADLVGATGVQFAMHPAGGRAGGRANGFVSKRKDLNDIYNAVKMILSGYSFFPSDTLNFINNINAQKGVLNDMPLSNREVTVLRYLANGLSNKEIAEQLLLSNKTISAHKANIYSKLGLHTIVELIDYAKMHELM